MNVMKLIWVPDWVSPHRHPLITGEGSKPQQLGSEAREGLSETRVWGSWRDAAGVGMARRRKLWAKLYHPMGVRDDMPSTPLLCRSWISKG